MAINLCSESPGFVMSPRISFSHNLCQNDVVQIESRHQDHRSDSSLLESNFDFCISSESFKQESSSADELFSDGKILPLLVREKLLPPKQNHQSDLPPPHPPTTNFTSTDMNSKKESLKEIMAMSSNSESAEKSSSKSFWRFKRSSSCGNGYKRSLICSLPLLSRSNSTGSAPIPKSKETQKHLQKPPLMSSSKSSYSSSSSQKPPLKKNYGSYTNINGIRINPVLNVPPPYISKGTANFLGLGSFFCNGKDKNKKK
ncbi:hypothetical protein BVC80_1725g17 [Macleaya cordata]|uniref:Membrane-associated kinase regulator n=1 Tax=Macleaya cordata TaxID=56857 RepID=A0A200QCE4_MACCD|nr:hypothetical protein BVC80_1725g17 [Macleaya cordata]